jgi:homoserine dehydrogenase
MLANVQGAMNAVLVHGDAVGQTVYYGAGAGALPTASAVVADLVDVTRLQTAEPEHRVPYLAFQHNAMSDTPILPMDEVVSSYYLRLRVDDRPGVLADVARILAQASISIGSMFQEPAGEQADIIFLTHEAREGAINGAISQIQNLPFVQSAVTRLRVENL